MNDARRHYRMVDVGGKEVTRRRAIATARIRMSAETFSTVRDGTLPKSDPLRLAEVAAVEAFCQASTSVRTGMEMEALAGVNGALLTIWGLAKPVQADLAIGDVRLLLKTGGKSGRYEHPDGVGELPRGFGS